MNIDEKVKALAELNWEDQDELLSHGISGWEERKSSIKSRSLEFRNTSKLRPKLLLPRPPKTKKKFLFPMICTPQPQKLQSIEEVKIDNLIYKLLEKSRKKFKDSKFSYPKNNAKIVTRIPFFTYKLNLPRSLNTLKSPKHLKEIKFKSQTTKPADKFSYRLTGTSVLSSKYPLKF